MTVYDKNKIFEYLRINLNFDARVELESRIKFLQEYVYAQPWIKSLVLGISGGQDSTLAAYICQRAVLSLRASGHECYFYAISLPYAKQVDISDVNLAVDFIKPDYFFTVNIEKMIITHENSIYEGLANAGFDLEKIKLSDFNRGNAKARARMLVQYSIASQLSGVVVGTDHAAEALTGFYTKWGDGAADIMPLFGLLKSQGAELLKYVDAPEIFWQKTPTADLLDDSPAKSDEEELGVTYKDIDMFLSGKEIGMTKEERIIDLYLKSSHKRFGAALYGDTWWQNDL